MQLIINHHTNGRLETPDGLSVESDRFYDLPDHPGARFIVRAKTHSAVVVEIKVGKKRKQFGTIQLLSATCGDRLTGGPVLHPYTVELDPDQPIWPIVGLVNELKGLGVHDGQISPMFSHEGTLTTCSASLFGPQMLTDGKSVGMFREAHTVNKGQLLRDLRARGEAYLEGEEDLSDSQAYSVTGASWAILHWGDGISHIYLWMTAADQAAVICKHVRRLTQSPT